jgi:hypothetical protein
MINYRVDNLGEPLSQLRADDVEIIGGPIMRTAVRADHGSEGNRPSSEPVMGRQEQRRLTSPPDSRLQRTMKAAHPVADQSVGCGGELVAIVAIDHVQLAMPAGMEQAARDFYMDYWASGSAKAPELSVGVRGSSVTSQDSSRRRSRFGRHARRIRRSWSQILSDWSLGRGNITPSSSMTIRWKVFPRMSPIIGNRIELMEPR